LTAPVAMMDATAMLGSSTLDGSIECGQRQFCIDITAYGVANNASTTVAAIAELKGDTTIAITRKFVMDVANQVYQPVI